MKTKSKNTTVKKREKSGVVRTILFGIGLCFCFLLILELLYHYVSPSRYTVDVNIPQAYTISESEGGTYFGEVIGTVYSGNGKFKYLKGGTYSGSFDNSKRSGEGTFTWENGDTFTGTWFEDKMETGTYLFSDGEKYVGDFIENKYGSGTFSFGNNAQAFGYSSFSAKYENGTVASLDFIALNGTTYSGAIDGTADITYSSGNSYSGTVKGGVRNGDGTYKWVSNGTLEAYYKGRWSNGQMSGKGVYHYSGTEYPYISGTFVNSLPDGTAIYYKEAGNTFDTSWANGKCSSVVES